jgi:hypothetical protein
MSQIQSLPMTGLLSQATCPNCWEKFAPEDVMWVSEHADLYDDGKLGSGNQRRFVPTRFNVAGQAIDARGMACHHLACPKCHLDMPRSMLELEPLFFSIFGSPGSGKSFFLSSMTWELRKILPLKFMTSFADADPALNAKLNAYEQSLFANTNPDRVVRLNQLVLKTQMEDDKLHSKVSYGGQEVSYARPFLFNVQPQTGHPNAGRADRLGRTVCLYDNAGEAFQTGADKTATPHTRHLALAKALFFVFDPTQEARFRREFRGAGSGLESGREYMRQEPILQEAAARVRRYSNLRQGQRCEQPLIVILTKCDQWGGLLAEQPQGEPFVMKSAAGSGRGTVHALNASTVERRSQDARSLLLRTCPEIVTAAEGFASDVTYVPVSAVGDKVEGSDEPSIRPADAKPFWATVPFLLGLMKAVPGMIPRWDHSR